MTTLTRGKIYDVVKKEGLGDVEDITVINDNGVEEEFSDFFFVNVE